MCGIVGIVARGITLPPEILEKATRSLAHRGPDDSGTIILRQSTPEAFEIGLGNRRLAILDLSPLGHQPMHDPATGNWIVFNGEIYNFRDIREDLEREGVCFTSNSDTEVLLKAYGRWAENCLTRLRGMFAFALWDASRQRLFLARDPMGIKPLYYHASEKYFLFSSELRTLLGTGLVHRRLDPAGLLNYLTFGSVYDPNTLIEGLMALLPGHYLVWQSGEACTKQYWDLLPVAGADAASDSPSKRDSCLKDVRNLLLESVRLHTVSDVPVGVFLSGGIDSSSLVALLTEIGTRANTFSLVFKESEYNEAEYSRAIAREFHTEHQEICVSARDALDLIPGALSAMDQPTIDGVNTYIVSRYTHGAGMRVALSGLGGDEMFAGYSTFRTVPRVERFTNGWRHMPGWLRWLAARVVSDGSDQKRKLAALLRNPDEVLHPLFLARTLFTPNQIRELVSEGGDTPKRASTQLTEMLDDARQLDPVNRVSYLECRGYMANTLLRDSDFMSMAHSLELRVPFIDHQLAAFLQSLPGEWKLDTRTPKPLLVRALVPKLPDRIVYRRKQGFTLPFEHWLKNEMRAEMEGTFQRTRGSVLSSIVKPSALSRVWQNFLAATTSWSRPWSLYVLNRWCEQHL